MCKKCEFKLITTPHSTEDEYWDIQFSCVDCGINTRDPSNTKDYYMVNHEIWKTHGSGDSMLCISCLETRMGRALVFNDFLPCLLNYKFNPYVISLYKP